MQYQIRSADALVRKIATDPVLLDKIKTDPLPELHKIAAEVVDDIPLSPPLLHDVWIYRLIVWALGLAIIISIIGSIIIALTGKSASESIVALGSVSVGALAGLLTPSPPNQTSMPLKPNIKP